MNHRHLAPDQRDKLLCWRCAEDARRAGHITRSTPPEHEKTICQICGRRSLCAPYPFTLKSMPNHSASQASHARR